MGRPSLLGLPFRIRFSEQENRLAAGQNFKNNACILRLFIIG